MNLWLRLIWLLLTAWKRPRLDVLEASSLPFRVWFHDLDPSVHMNNGRYLSIMDLGRVDVILRTGLWRAIVRHRWTPVASAVLIRFRRELRLFTRYRLKTRILAWDSQSIIMEQVFVFDGGPADGQTAARALVKGAIYDRAQRRYVPVTQLMSEIGTEREQPQLLPEVEAFLSADAALRQEAPPSQA